MQTTTNTTTALTADFLRDLSIIAEDENLMQQAIRYIKRLAARQRKSDPTLMTKQEFFAKLERAEKDLEQGKGKRFDSLNEMNTWLNAL
jgi:hypothetical protein